jgi:hypothetical protein
MVPAMVCQLKLPFAEVSSCSVCLRRVVTTAFKLQLCKVSRGVGHALAVAVTDRIALPTRERRACQRVEPLLRLHLTHDHGKRKPVISTSQPLHKRSVRCQPPESTRTSSSRVDGGKDTLSRAKIQALEQFVKFGRKGKQKDKDKNNQKATEFPLLLG